MPPKAAVDAVHVAASVVSGESSLALSPAQVEADGSYRIPDLSPGRWTVLVLLRSRGLVAQEAVEIGDGEEEVLLDIEIPAGALD